MFEELIEKQISIEYFKKVLIKDYDGLIAKHCKNFKVKYRGILHEYQDVEKFRYIYETKIKGSTNKCIVLVSKKMYIPYDVLMYFNAIDLSYEMLFPKLNSFILKNTSVLDFDLLTIAYENLYESLLSEKDTKEFINKLMYSKSNVKEYVAKLQDKIRDAMQEDMSYNDWFQVSSKKATMRWLELMSSEKYNISGFDKIINEKFKGFILDKYKGLSGRSTTKSPILLSKVMDFILMKQEKFVVIVMDGMSVADWNVLSGEFNDIEFDLNYSFALIPTLTSISRQSLFSGKLPIEIDNPFSLAKEKNLFIEKCMEYGYKQEQIKYHRGYDVDLSVNDKCLAIVINDIDDLVHNQLQGYSGMYRDIYHLAKTQKLQKLIKKLFKAGFTIYLTSDHGNVEADGIGKVKGIGVEVETKSQRVVIYKDFASEERVKNEFNVIEYPGYYLPKDNKYLICEDRSAFAAKGEQIVSHGGISIEEVIVPFITIKGVKDE